MRLAFILHHYFPYGGLQRDAMKIALACQQQGHHVEFLTMGWDAEQNASMPVHFFPQKNKINYRRYQQFEKDVQDFLAQHSYDGVIGFNKMTGLDIYYAADPCFAAQLKRRRWGWFYRWLPRYRYFLEAEAQVAHSDTQLLLMSDTSLQDFKNCYDIPDERLHFLPPGINRDRCWTEGSALQRLAKRKELNLEPEDKLLLLIGSAFKTKGVDRAIRGLATLPEILRKKTVLLVIGKDKPKRFLALAEKLNVAQQVRFILGTEDIPALLFAADLLVHPARLENAGMVLLEAVVAGLPVFTTANCGYASYIEKADAGVVLPVPFKQSQFNEQLAKMLASSKLSQWRDNGIEFGHQHDLYSLPEKAAGVIQKI